MKHFKSMMLVMLMTVFGVNAHALTVNEPDHYYCSFATVDEFNQWTKINVNGVDDYGFNDWFWNGDEGGQIYYHPWATDGDDWVISPAVTLTGEKKMAVKIKLHMNPYNMQDRMQFTFGTANTVEGQTTILLDEVYSVGYYYITIPLPEDTPAGTYYFGIHALAPGWGGPDYVQSFEVVENSDCTLNLQLKNVETQEPIANANVTLSSDYYKANNATTDAEGKCSYTNLSPGTYKVNAEVDGYIPVEGQEVVIAAGESTADATVEMKSVLYSTVTGHVVDYYGDPEKGAVIRLDGEDIDYEVTPDENGVFTIEKVRRPRVYEMTITKDFKVTYRQTLTINEEDESKDLEYIELEDYVASPINFKAEPTGRGMFLSWMVPLDNCEFAQDNGVYLGIYTIENPVYATMGTLFREPMRVTSVSWMAANVADELVDVYVYVLGSDGSIPSKPVYEAKGVPTRNYKDEADFVWPEHMLPQPIDAPYGCIVAIGHEQSLTIALDYLNNSGTSLTTGLPTDGWDVCRLSNFFIRAKGNPLRSDITFDESSLFSMNVRCKSQGKADSRQKAALMTNTPAIFKYNIWRLADGTQEDKSSWTELASDTRCPYFIDNDFSKLEQGVYRYAIQTLYPGRRKSEIAFSEPVDHQMLTSLVVNVYTNTAINFSEGTEIKLVNVDNEALEYVATVKDNKATFDNVRKGSYTMTATKAGFNTVTTDMDLTSSNSYETSIDMALQPVAPFNLQARQAEDSQDVILNWNGDDGIFEDCETMEDFAVNPTGICDWTYADVDGVITYGVKQCESAPYPNMFAPMAYQAFNPSATTPGLLEYVQPHSGDKMLVSVSVQDVTKSNDDYLFSPELSFDSDFILEFYAASGFYASLGNEEFMVGYTTGEATPENVTWITEKPQTVGAVWTKFAYDMPKDARHIVIRCVSNQHMFFMLDDFFVGRREAETFAMTTFNVYLDDELVANTASKSMTFNNLTEGKHLAKVQTVYPMLENDKAYSDFTELMFTVDAVSGIDTPVADVLYTYNNNVIVPGDKAESIDLYDMQGRLCATCKAGETISTENFVTGVYLIRISYNGTASFGKILVK